MNTKTFLSGVAMTTAIGLSGPAAAQSVLCDCSTVDSYIGVLATYTFADDERLADLDYATGAKVLFGKQFTDSAFGYEFNAFFDTFETDLNGTDFYRSGLGLDLTLRLGGDRSGFTPFLIAGIGGAYNDVVPDDEDDFDFTANAGLGFVTGPLTDSGQLRLRGEGRYVYDNFLDGFGDIRVGLGLEFAMFKPAEAPAPAEAQVQVVEVPTGLVDSDGDGVVDEKDNCPDTPAGTRVDGVGCPLDSVITLHGVTFEFNKDRLTADAKTILDGATETLTKYPEMQVEVAGHTDSVGSEAYNLDLSKRRAAAVVDYFVANGVGSSQLTSEGYGESEPIETNDTAEGRELNRRVELRILN